MKNPSSQQFIALDSQNHRDIQINQASHFAHARSINTCRVGFTEIVSLASCMPIVILEGNQQTPAVIAAMMGLQQEQNLFYEPMIGWQGHCVPLSIQSAPFNYATESDKLIVLIDQSAITEQGERLFSSDGAATPLLKQKQRILGDLAQGLTLSQQFIDTLQSLNLLTKLTITLTDKNQQQRTISGCLSIDDSALAQLDDATIAKLHRSGMLMAINSMMLSLRQFNRLVQLSNQTEIPIETIKISVSE